MREPLPIQSFNKSKKLLYGAIRAGHCFIGYDLLADSTGFSFTGMENDAEPLLMGDGMNLRGKVLLMASTPLDAEIRLIRNGELIKTERGKFLKFEIDRPGAYRIEAYYDDKPWIFSNHIFLNGGSPQQHLRLA